MEISCCIGDVRVCIFTLLDNYTYRRVNGESIHRLRFEVQLADQRNDPTCLRGRLSLPNSEKFFRLLKRRHIFMLCLANYANMQLLNIYP